MTPNAHARSGYAAAATPIRTDRGTEYAVFAQVTHRLSSVDETDKASFPRLAAAVCDNQRLWGVLAEDLMSEDERAADRPARASSCRSPSSCAGTAWRCSPAAARSRRSSTSTPRS